MEDYKIIEIIGDGSFGTVMRASNIKTGEIVAIKKMKKKFNSWEECMGLRELKSLTKLKNHQNIIKLKEALRVKDELFFIFEFMEQNLYQLYTQMKESGNPFTENQIRTIMFQTTSGLAYMHKHGFFHRDLKPENLLISAGVTKIADFGLAREIRSRPPFTDYVATRWYRAPEILLKAPNYNSPVDIFALGCIMAELYLGAPLFKGNNELEQMYKICSILGTPTQTTWSDGCRQAAQIGFTFPQCTPVNLASMMPNASDDAIQLITEMLQFDPQKRPSSSQILQHPFFANYVPTTKGFAPTGSHIIRVPSGSRKSGVSGSADERFIKKPHQVKEHSYSVKHAHTEEDEHLGILDDLEVEDTHTTTHKKFDSEMKKIEKTLEVEKQNSLEENTDALLAEIEAVVNSDKQDMNLQYGNKASFGNFGKNSFAHSKPTLTSTMSTGNMKAPITNKGMMDYSQKGDIFDKGWGMGPSSFDLLQKNTPTYGKTTQFGQGSNNPSGGTGDLYKFNGSPHWNQGQNNISNRGAHIMNAFVYSSNKNIGANSGLVGSNLATSSFKGSLNNGYGQDDSEGFGKFGY